MANCNFCTIFFKGGNKEEVSNYGPVFLLPIIGKKSYITQLLTGWVYYRISNAMQYSNLALETTALVIHDSNKFYQGGGGPPI